MDRKIILNRMRRNPFFVIGAIAAAILIVVLLSAPLIIRYDPVEGELGDRTLPPEWFARGLDGHVLGTDQLGRDIFARLLMGGRASLILAVVCSILQIILGSVLGIMAGYFGKWVDAVVMRTCDVFMSIPNLILAIAVMAIFGASMLNLIIVLTLTGWIRCCKITRNDVRMIRHQEFVHASQALGAKGSFIMFRQILPNVTTQIIIQGSQRIGLSILIEASLSFLSLGIQPPAPSWGNMISVGRAYMTTYPWMVFAPGVALMITCLAFNFLGDGLRDVLDPRRTVVKLTKKTKSDKAALAAETAAYEAQRGEADPDTLLEINNLVVEYKTERAVVQAINGLDLVIKKGESVGLVGESGAGKTTTALSVLNLLPDPAGERIAGNIRFHGKSVFEMDEKELLSMRGGKISMIFQNPLTALNPVFTVGEQVAVMLRIHRQMKRKEAMARASELLEMVGIAGNRVKDFPNQFSGGMRQRVGIAASLACNPELLIADEPTTALDVTIQAQILELMKELQIKYSTSLLMITHNLGIISELCQKVAVMYAGRIIEYGSVREVFKSPQHPYTQGLLGALPSLEGSREQLTAIPGRIADAQNLPDGCRFHPRCEHCTERCSAQQPPMIRINDNHYVSCYAVEAARESDVEEARYGS